MNANKKRLACPLDRGRGAQYYLAPMLRVLALFSLAVVLTRCATGKAVTLPAKKLADHFSKTAQPATTDANETGSAASKPRLIVPGMQLSVAVEQDHSLNRSYTV